MAPSTKLLLLSLIPFLAAKAQEDIRLPPSIVIGPEKQVFLAENARGTLRCIATGHPLPTMSWRKNSQDLAFDGILPAVLPLGNGTIEIVRMNASHVGRYQCIASNEHGTAMTLVSALELATLSPFDPNSGNRITNRSVEANAALRLPCQPPSSAPAASIGWTWNMTGSPQQTPVIPSKTAHIDYNGDLCFASVNLTETQGRLYRCNVFNEPKQATTSGSYTRITGQGSVSNVAPRLLFQTKPNPYIALRSTQTVLRCFFSGTGPMSYQWTYNGASALPTGWTAADTDLLSPETGTPVSDAGTFTCYGNNGQGPAASASIALTVEALPEFRDGPGAIVDVNVTNGDQLTLSCASDALPTASVQWYKNTQPFDEKSLPAKFSLSADRLTLKITDVCKNCSDGTSDLMVIQCLATNGHGSTLAQGYVNVLLPTVIMSESTSVPWVAYATYSFDCLATCDDSSTVCDVEWSFDGKRIESNGASLIIGDDGSLTINTGNDTDGGLDRTRGSYKCRATNGYSEQSITCTINAPPVEIAELWWVGLLVALLVLLLLLLVLCCCFFCFFREGKSYPVDKNERKNGNDPEKELLAIGFQDYMHSKNQPVDIYANPVYGVADLTAPPPIYKGPFNMDYTEDYTVNQDRNTPSGSRKGGYGDGGRDSPSAGAPVEATQQKSVYRPVNGNHSWNSSEV